MSLSFDPCVSEAIIIIEIRGEFIAAFSAYVVDKFVLESRCFYGFSRELLATLGAVNYAVVATALSTGCGHFIFYDCLAPKVTVSDYYAVLSGKLLTATRAVNYAVIATVG